MAKAKNTTKAKSAAKTVAKAGPTDSQKKGGTVLKAICAKLKIEPKTARRVLRKRMRSTNPEIAKFHTIKTRWVQTPKDAAVIESVLREYLQAA
jgi:hypothetical protein